MQLNNQGFIYMSKYYTVWKAFVIYFLNVVWLLPHSYKIFLIILEKIRILELKFNRLMLKCSG